jgi:hypothetical protein
MLTFRVGVLRAVLLVAACGGGSGGPVDPNGTAFGITATGPGVLAVSPIDTASVIWTTPLGSIAPPGHVLPTDHVYISFVDAYSGNQQNNDCMTKRPIYAAGSGVIEFTIVTETRGDTKVSVQMTKTFHYYYDHVLLLPGFVVGTRVSAGQQIATTAGGCPSFDIGVWDLEATNGGFVNPARYGASTLHATSPYKYFTAPLRALYLARSRLLDGVPANKDGRIDWGITGKLVGDWFHSSLAVDANSSGSPDGWSKSIAFTYDWYDNSKPVISIGGTITTPGAGPIAATDPDPATISPSSGLIANRIAQVKTGLMRPGWLLVQMTASDHIRVEYFPDAAARPAAFTAAAQDYLR